MAPLKTSKLFVSILLILTTSILADDSPFSKLSCPTITKSTSHSDCPAPTPSYCAQPYCIIESRIPIPCGCPAELPTSTAYTACPTTCSRGCGTYFTPLMAPCPPPTSLSTTLSTPIYTPSSPPPTTTTPILSIPITMTTITTQPSSCSTITVSEGPECWTAGCQTTYSRCQTTRQVTLQCGCKSIPTVTSCKKQCDGGCITAWRTAYLPCPMSMTTPWGPPPTSVDE